MKVDRVAGTVGTKSRVIISSPKEDGDREKNLAEGMNSQTSGKLVTEQKMPALRERGKKPRYSKRYSVFVFNPFNNTYHSLYTPFKKSIAKTKKKEK